MELTYYYLYPTGGDIDGTGKDDIIKELNDYINRLKCRNSSLENMNENKQVYTATYYVLITI